MLVPLADAPDGAPIATIARRHRLDPLALGDREQHPRTLDLKERQMRAVRDLIQKRKVAFVDQNRMWATSSHSLASIPVNEMFLRRMVGLICCRTSGQDQ